MIADEAKLIKALAYAEYISDLRAKKQQREDEIECARSDLGGTANALGTRVDKSPSADAIPNAVIRLQEMIKDYCTDLVGYVDEISTFRRTLDKLETTQARVLSLRYLSGLEYPQIADRLNYHERTIYRIREAGLIALYDVMPEYWRGRAIPDAEPVSECQRYS